MDTLLDWINAHQVLSFIIALSFMVFIVVYVFLEQSGLIKASTLNNLTRPKELTDEIQNRKRDYKIRDFWWYMLIFGSILFLSAQEVGLVSGMSPWIAVGIIVVGLTLRIFGNKLPIPLFVRKVKNIPEDTNK